MKKRTLLIVGIILTLVAVNVAAVAPLGAQDAPTLVVWADDTRAPVLNDLAEGFEAETGVALEVQEVGFGDIREQIKVAGPAGEGPDILIGAHDWLGELVANGLVAEMDLGDLAGDFVPAALQAFTFEGTLYGLPYALENVAFFRNTDLVPDAPETWDDVRAISEELTDADAGTYGFVIQQNDPFHFYGIQTAFGGYVFGTNDDGSYNPDDVGIDSEGSIAAAEWLEGMAADGLIPAGLDWDPMHALFETGDAAMFITGPWALDRLQESGVNYAISDIPGEGQPFLGVQGFMINAFSENQALAQAFLTNFVATEDTMQALWEAGNRPSALTSVFDGIEDEDFAAFGSAGVNAQPMPAIPEMGAVWGAWGDAMQLVHSGEAGGADAFGDAAEAIRTTIAEGAE